MAGPVQFGPFEFDPGGRELRKRGLRIRVPDQSLEILAALLEQPGATVTRDTIRMRLWPDGTIVAFDQSINAAVKGLRHALGDSGGTPRFVERVPRQGYRFIAPVRVLDPDPPDPTPPPRHRRLYWTTGGMAAAAVALWLWPRSDPPLSGRDTLVLAGFTSQPGDPVLANALGQVLYAQMGQSPALRIASEEHIRSTLALMGRAPADPLTPAVARDLCRRLGGKAIVAGTAGALGRRFFLTLRATACADGEALGAQYAEADSREGLLAALGPASGRMRASLGESLASIRKLSTPVEASTPSMEALNAYSLALADKAVGRDPLPALQHAIALDPDFATAQFTLAQVYLNRGRQDEAEKAITRAFALRGRCSERERLAIENFYHIVATGDLPQALAAGRLAAQTYPLDAAARRSVFLPAILAGDEVTARRVAQSELEQAPEDGVSYFNQAVVELNSGDVAAGRATLQAAAERGIRYDLLPFARYAAAALAGDHRALDQEAEAARGQPFELGVRMLRLGTAACNGQLALARRIATEPEPAPVLQAQMALIEALFGRTRDAVADARAVLRRDRSRRTQTAAALALALAGDREAQVEMDDLHRRYPSDTRLNQEWRPAARAALELALGRPAEALQAVAPRGQSWEPWPVYMRAQALLRLHQPAAAESEFQAILNHKPHLFLGSIFFEAAALYPPAQLGLAQAQAQQGKHDASRRTLETFQRLWTQADPGLPLSAQARLAVRPQPAERAAQPADR